MVYGHRPPMYGNAIIPPAMVQQVAQPAYVQTAVQAPARRVVQQQRSVEPPPVVMQSTSGENDDVLRQLRRNVAAHREQQLKNRSGSSR